MAKVIRFTSRRLASLILLQGELNYSKSFKSLYPYVEDADRGVIDEALQARLYIDDQNRLYPNGVRVEIGGYPVGYLSNSAAKKYRKFVSDLGSDVIGECVGSVRKDKGGYSKFRVALDIELDHLEIAETINE